MSFSVMGALAGIGSTALSGASTVGSSFLNGAIGHYFGKKSSKYTLDKQLTFSKAMADYNTALQKRYNTWLIPFQNDSNYQYQLRYARNSPTAQVSGLRKAGLNPILAAGGGFHPSSMSGASASSIPSAPSASSGYTPSGGNGRKLFDPLLVKQLQLLDAQIDGQKIKNNNDIKNRGLQGQYGALSRVISEMGITSDDPINTHRPKDYTKIHDKISTTLDSLGSYLGTIKGDYDSKSGASSYLKFSPRTLDDARRRNERAILKSVLDDAGPTMQEHKKPDYYESDGFDSRLWRRFRDKRDGQYRYQRRQPWERIFSM